jgi:hypothetical protein
MKFRKPLLITLLITLCGTFPITQARAGDTNSQITPVVTVAPNLFAVGQFSTTFVCLSNGNPNSTKSIQSGDTFKLTFDPSIGALAAVVAPVLVNSSNLNAADFTAILSSVPNQIVITYNGATKVFTPGDSICVKVTFMANSVIASGKITCDSPTANGDPGRYNSIEPKYTTISIVDFATGPPGPPGPGGVTSVSGTSPIVVTNPTTTPNISLGIVPTGNGGTGLGAAGATGNFLRSNGGAWTSAPLAPADIPAGNGNYIQNGASQQAGASFNISGDGTAGGTLSANTVNAATQYTINGVHAFSQSGAFNVFAGANSGVNNTGAFNSFFGRNSGQSNTSGGSNSFFGFNAGVTNTTGGTNSFFGYLAGTSNTTGSTNSFFGGTAGLDNTTGSANSFFGYSAGIHNMTGTNNSFYGVASGFRNNGDGNSFFGSSAGNNNTTGQLNSFFGEGAGGGNTTGSDNAFFGILAGSANTTGSNNTIIGPFAGHGNTAGDNLTFVGASTAAFVNNLSFATAIGAGSSVFTSNTVVLGRSVDRVQIPGAMDVKGGSVVIGSPGQGIILKSPDGTTCRLLSIDNTGAMVLSAVACP